MAKATWINGSIKPPEPPEEVRDDGAHIEP